jgi:hypothetical protein
MIWLAWFWLDLIWVGGSNQIKPNHLTHWLRRFLACRRDTGTVNHSPEALNPARRNLGFSGWHPSGHFSASGQFLDCASLLLYIFAPPSNLGEWNKSVICQRLFDLCYLGPITTSTQIRALTCSHRSLNTSLLQRDSFSSRNIAGSNFPSPPDGEGDCGAVALKKLGNGFLKI